MIRTPVSLALVAASAAMVFLNIHWWRTPPDLSPIEPNNAVNLSYPQVADGDADQPDRELALAPVESLLRPLFHAMRRPFVPPPVEPVEEEFVEEPPPPLEIEPESVVAETMPDLRLAGISLTSDRSRALIGPAKGGDFRWYGRGEEVSGWTVVSITRAAVTLESGGRNLTVSLYSAAPASSVTE
jgi:hypothetical protein